MNGRALFPVPLYWIGYLLITLAVGYATTMLIPDTVWQLILWGFLSSALLLALPRLLERDGSGTSAQGTSRRMSAGLPILALGFVLGCASFAVHVFLVHQFAGPLRFERVPEIGAMAALLFLARFLATSSMEEIGFHGFTLRRLSAKVGPWPAVLMTAIAFGLSHLSYGWDLRTIALGVIPGGILWGMSALATRGLAMPIGLHAAWNFAGWITGSRNETGALRLVVEDGTLQRTQEIGSISYWAICGVLTFGFWLYHFRSLHQAFPDWSRP